ncbi:MAG TPA: hypothetical protein VLU92_09455, partial [Candidatus Dormibacteraeota bacterium]|nr:hypothetical protein [Candidatus Dormibacteraeota bacterium]
SHPGDAGSLWSLLEWLARYPGSDGEDEVDAPAVSDAVAVTGGSDPRLLEALETVKNRGGRARAWVVGDAQLEVDVPVSRIGTGWPL